MPQFDAEMPAARAAEGATAGQDWAEAARCWRIVEAATRGKDRRRAVLELARAHRMLGDLNAAERALGRWLRRRPRDHLATRRFAELAAAREDWPEAVARWMAALDAAGPFPPARLFATLGKTLRLAGRMSAARDALARGLGLHPRNARLLCEWALACNGPATAAAPRERATVPEAAIVVPVHDAPADVRRCLDSLEKTVGGACRLILVNDASDKETRTLLENFAECRPWVHLIRNAANLGYTRSANLGLKAARGDWVVLLNSDTVATSGWLEGLLECALSSPLIKAVGPLSNAATFQSVTEPRDGASAAEAPCPSVAPEHSARCLLEASVRAFPRVPMLNGFCTLFHRVTLAELGYLDEESFPVGYGEENDLCLRLIAAGHQLAIADHVYVHHARSASFGEARRRILTAEGVAALQALWPDYSYRHASDGVASLPAMEALRERMRQALSRPHDAPAADPPGTSFR